MRLFYGFIIGALAGVAIHEQLASFWWQLDKGWKYFIVSVLLLLAILPSLKKSSRLVQGVSAAIAGFATAFFIAIR